ncbi:L-seryl-tRNA selenium transferase [Campylobacter gastrosuis]|uniref:L-seryl-tRNA selenium transferase n=1 Tax=Campylobacter gastrosuis TaxID=2974576 RepID=A0ABT7HNQ2_9BACT|nr:L-seryl-tRNA selenium transferase [Campylobacter gastrosuis]MDL0088544.1 L-seryl-tRNA selenium transferase [Campylobacter gastrosuis]
MKNFALVSIILALFLSGCNTKRQYFEPEITSKDSIKKHSLDSKISDVSIAGVTLKNSNIITKNGQNSKIKLKEGFKFLGEDDGLFISANLDGVLEVSDDSGNIVFSKQYGSAIVAASIKSGLIAAVSALNHIYLIDLNSAQTLMEYKSSEVFAIDSRVAAPVFLNSIIIYPSLDGRIYVVQKSGQILKDIVISSETFFNNVTYLDVIDDNMIAATAKKVIVINPQKISYFDGEIKNFIRHGNEIFIFKKDGGVVKTDLELNELAKNYFKFAIFSGASVVNNKLYIVEKTGYIIQTDLNLANTKIIELSDEIDDKSFISGDKFYYDNEFVKFE